MQVLFKFHEIRIFSKKLNSLLFVSQATYLVWEWTFNLVKVILNQKKAKLRKRKKKRKYKKNQKKKKVNQVLKEEGRKQGWCGLELMGVLG